MTRSDVAEPQSGIGRLARSLFKGRTEEEAPQTRAAAGGEAAEATRAAEAKRAAKDEDEAARTASPSATAPATAADPDDILSDLRCWAAEISDEGFQPDELDPHASIFDEGYVDSMSYVELLARVEERYGVAVPDERVAGSSLNELAVYIAEEFAG